MLIALALSLAAAPGWAGYDAALGSTHAATPAALRAAPRPGRAAVVVIEELPAGLQAAAAQLAREHLEGYDDLRVILESGGPAEREVKAAYDELRARAEAVDVFLLTSWDYVYQIRFCWRREGRPRLLYLSTAEPSRCGADATLFHRVPGRGWAGAIVPLFLVSFLPEWTRGVPLDEAVERANRFIEGSASVFFPRLAEVVTDLSADRGLDRAAIERAFGRALHLDEREQAQMLLDTRGKLRGQRGFTIDARRRARAP